MVLVNADRDIRVHQLQRLHYLFEHDVVGVGACAAARLENDRAVGSLCRFQDREPLLHVVDVEGGHAIAVLGGVVEKLSQCDTGHD
jgi:hypothetical protein